MFVVEKWRGGGPLKVNGNKQGQGVDGVKPICNKACLLCEKNCLIFLISCLAFAKIFAVLNLIQHVKGRFLLQSRGYFFRLTFLYELENIFKYCHCIYNYLKNIDPICLVYKKINYFLSFQSRIFHSEIHNCHGTFLSRGK